MTVLSRYLLGLAALLVFAPALSAQVKVDISFKRALYMRYEPIMCSVSMTNLSGRELLLQDTRTDKWFGFNIESTDGRPLPPIDNNYKNEPLRLEVGQTLTRTINLTPLFPLSEFGTYRVKAAIFADGRYFASDSLNIGITEGRELWQQTVGVPDGVGGGPTRTVSLLSHRLSRTSMLYIRIEDKDAGVIYCTHQLGRFIAFSNPDIQLDHSNQVHILQNVAPKAFVYSQIGLNGEVVKRQAYQDGGQRPVLVKDTQGVITVMGGTPFDPNEETPEKKVPKLSDRPVPLPTPTKKATPAVKKQEPAPTAED